MIPRRNGLLSERAEVDAREETAGSEVDPPWDLEPATIREDEEEVFDLGFIIEDHEDRRAAMFEHWQRLESLDTDEVIETDPGGALPEEIARMRRAGLPEEWYPSDALVTHARAERSEQEFAEANQLLVDPQVESLAEMSHDTGTAAAPDPVDVPGLEEVRISIARHLTPAFPLGAGVRR
jgi:hypothetical protein